MSNATSNVKWPVRCGVMGVLLRRHGRAVAASWACCCGVMGVLLRRHGRAVAASWACCCEFSTCLKIQVSRSLLIYWEGREHVNHNVAVHACVVSHSSYHTPTLLPVEYDEYWCDKHNYGSPVTKCELRMRMLLVNYSLSSLSTMYPRRVLGILVGVCPVH